MTLADDSAGRLNSSESHVPGLKLDLAGPMKEFGLKYMRVEDLTVCGYVGLWTVGAKNLLCRFGLGVC